MEINVNKKIMSVNLWYEKYGNKTRAQLKSFRNAGFKTYVSTISHKDNKIILCIYNLTTNQDCAALTDETLIASNECSGYRSAFKYLFNYCLKENFSIIYIRRLMSKLLTCFDLINKVNKKIPVVYEIPTYPLDTGNGFLYKIRDLSEMLVFKNLCHVFTLVNLIADEKVPSNWHIFHNAIDIDNYRLYPAPDITDTIKLIIVANIAEYHNYERILNSIKKYSGSYKIELGIISPDSNAYQSLKKQIKDLNLEDCIKEYGSLSLEKIRDISKDYHIGIGQLSSSEKGSNIVNTLKSKDYCAMGLPFVSTCYDTSFEKDFPYAFITDNMDSDIDLNKIIDWYLEIAADSDYRKKMFTYAQKNLQFNQLVDTVVNECM